MKFVKTKVILILLASAFFVQGCKKKEPILASVTLGAITEITDATAKVAFNVTSDGYSTIIERGIRISDKGCPSCEISSIKFTATGTIGSGIIELTGLKNSTQYTVAAYVINGIGVAYSSNNTFTTSAKVPTVSPDNSTILGISATKAIFTNYRITDDGGTTAFYSGLCWATNANPTVNDSKTRDTIINKVYASWNIDITNLKPNTKYYVRPYAINSVGVGYGKELSFTTDVNFSCQPNAIEPESSVTQIIPISSEKFMLVGPFQKVNGLNHFNSAIFNTDGSIDNNYSAKNTDPINFTNSLYLPSGKIILPLRTNSGRNTTVVRLNANGSPDNSFASSSGTSGTILRMFTTPDGKIILVGRFTDFNNMPANKVIRLNADGSRDGSFPISTSFDFGYILNAAMLSNGSIVIQSSATNGYQNYVIKADGNFDTNSRLHNAFNPNFILAVLKNDQFLCSAKAPVGTASVIRRINADGSIDATFNGIGFDQTTNTSFIVQELSDSKYLLAVNTSNNSTAVCALTRFNNNGTQDVSFGVNGGAGIEYRDGRIYALAMSGDGKILVGGSFNMFLNRSARNFIALNANGTTCN